MKIFFSPLLPFVVFASAVLAPLTAGAGVNGRELHAGPGASAADRGGDGSAENPFRSLHDAVANLEAGDTLLLHAGVYSLDRPLRPGPGGRSDAWIEIKAAGDGPVVLDGAAWKHTPEVRPRLGSTGLIHIEGPSHLRLRGLTVVNSLAIGIFVRGPSHHIEVLDCRVEHTYACGIGVWNTHDIRILRCFVSDANNEEYREPGTPKPPEPPHEAISLGGVSDFEVAWNRVVNCHKEGIDVKEASRRGRVHHNVVIGMKRQGLYLDAWFGLLEEVSVDHNFVSDCEWGAAISVEGEGSTMRRVWIHNNVLIRNRGSGFYSSTWGLNLLRSEVVIAHNTLWRNGRVDHWSGGTGGIDLRSRAMRDVTVVNNIVVESGAYGIGADAGAPHPNPAIAATRIGTNLVFPWVALRGESDRPRYGKPAAVESSNLIIEDPLFVAPESGDFRLSEQSPARGRAEPVKLPHAKPMTDLGASPEVFTLPERVRGAD